METDTISRSRLHNGSAVRPAARTTGRVKAAIAAMLLAGAAMGLLGCSRPQQAAAAKAGKPAAPTVFPVSVSEAVMGDLNDYISLTGSIEAANQVEVYADASGQLTRLNVRLGEYVRQNEVVAEVDPSRPGQNFVPNPVRAPIAGTVTALPVDVGARITQGVPVLQISTIADLRIHTQVAERYIGRMHTGENAIVTLEPYPGEPFAARIVELSPVVDAQSRTLDVTLAFTRRDDRIKAGMFVEIKLITEHRQSILKIPSDAVVERGDRLFVFVAGNDNKAVRKDVKIGIRIDGKAEVLSGLAAGDRIVVRGQTLLENGSAIRILEQVPPLSVQDKVL